MSLPTLPPFGEFTVVTLALLPLDGHSYEVIDGELYILAPQHDPHDAIVESIRARMMEYANSVGLTVLPRRKRLQFSERRLVFPDLVFTPSSCETVTQPPALIVEVSTRWSRNADWNIKPELYMSEGVGEYWILDLEARYAIVRRRGETKPKIAHDSIIWQPEPTRAALELDLQRLFAIIGPPSTLDSAEPAAESRDEMDGRLHEWTARMIDVTPDDGCRYEVFDGALSITPVPPLIHQIVLGELMFPLHGYAKTHGLGFIMGPIGVHFGPKTLVQPDLVVYRTRYKGDDVDERRAQECPILIVEILAPYTTKLDREVKRALYANQGVSEYWIVDIEARSVERWLPHSTAAEVLRDAAVWQPRRDCEALVIDLVSVFRHVYED